MTVAHCKPAPPVLLSVQGVKDPRITMSSLNFSAFDVRLCLDNPLAGTALPAASLVLNLDGDVVKSNIPIGADVRTMEWTYRGLKFDTEYSFASACRAAGSMAQSPYSSVLRVLIPRRLFCEWRLTEAQRMWAGYARQSYCGSPSQRADTPRRPLLKAFDRADGTATLVLDNPRLEFLPRPTAIEVTARAYTAHPDNSETLTKVQMFSIEAEAGAPPDHRVQYQHEVKLTGFTLVEDPATATGRRPAPIVYRFRCRLVHQQSPDSALYSEWSSDTVLNVGPVLKKTVEYKGDGEFLLEFRQDLGCMADGDDLIMYRNRAAYQELSTGDLGPAFSGNIIVRSGGGVEFPVKSGQHRMTVRTTPTDGRFAVIAVDGSASGVELSHGFAPSHGWNQWPGGQPPCSRCHLSVASWKDEPYCPVAPYSPD